MDSVQPIVDLKADDRVLLVRAGGDATEETTAAVVSISDTSICLDVDPKIIFVKPGALMSLRPEKQKELVGFGKLQTAERKDGRLLLTLEELRWEQSAEGRAERLVSDYRAIATFVDPNSETKETKRTTGTAVNVSLTGIRMKVRSPIPIGSMVHVQIFLSSDKSVNVLAKTARIIKGSEAHGGGFEIGISFVRFLDGYEEFISEMGGVTVGEADVEEQAA